MRVVGRIGILAAASLLAAGCSSTGGESVSLAERIMLAGPSVPPSVAAEDPDVFCPPVQVIPGASAIQNGGGDGPPRSVVTLGQLARECVGRADGSTLVKVGVEGRAIQSAPGGRFDVPVQIVVKSGEGVIANRARRAAVTFAPGAAQGSFVVVEEGLVVPAGSANTFQIQVGIGAGAGRRG
jgi:hypothetical protein